MKGSVDKGPCSKCVAGELVVGLAQAQLAGTGYWSGLDQVRAVRSLPRCRRYRFWLPRPLPGWPGGCHRRAHRRIEAGSAQDRARCRVLRSAERRWPGAVTMDMDSTDVEAFAQISRA